MKTPKLSTPASKSKLNTPRSGFIKKNGDSAKKVKFNVLNAEVTKNGTPKIEHTPFKEKRKFNNFSGKKSFTPSNNMKVTPEIDENDELDNVKIKSVSPIKGSSDTNKSPKTKFSPGTNKNNDNKFKSVSPIAKGSPGINKSPNTKGSPDTNKKENNLSPRKRKAVDSSPERLLSSEKSPRKISPKSNIQSENSPNNKTTKSPEVQLGLDIEQFLDKNSSVKKKKKSPHSTPLGVLQENAKIVKLPSKLSQTKPTLKKVSLKGINIKKNKKPKISKVITDSENLEPLVNQTTTKCAVEAILKYIEENPREKNEMLNENCPILMQLNFIKVPATTRTKIQVPHKILSEDSDICLIIADKNQGFRDPDDLIDAKKELLKKCGVTGISEIIPWKKLIHEYTQYEERRKLGCRFDAFLIESKLAKIKLGKSIFTKFPNSRQPIPVNLDKESELKSIIEAALRKVHLISTRKGLTHSVVFGHNNMSAEMLTENIDAILKVICNEKDYPGGRCNIRSIILKTFKSVSFPLYISTKSQNRVEAPKKQVVEKPDEGVEGELSTFTNKMVKVFKDGRTVVRTIKENDDKEPKKTVKEIKGNKKQGKDKKAMIESEEEEDDDDDDDDDDNDVDLEDLEDEDEIEKDSQEEEDEDDDDDVEEDEDDDDDDDEDDDLEEDDSEIDDEEIEKSNKKFNKKMKKDKNDSSSDENELDEAEKIFLKELRQMQDEIENKKPQKKGQVQPPGNKKNETKKVAVKPPQKKQQNVKPNNKESNENKQIKTNNANNLSQKPKWKQNKESKGNKQDKTNNANNLSQKPKWKQNKESKENKQNKSNNANNLSEKPKWKQNKNKQKNNSPVRQKQVPGAKKFKSKA